LGDFKVAIRKILNRFDDALKRDYFTRLNELIEGEQLEEILSWVKTAEKLCKRLDEYSFEENISDEELKQLFRQVADVSPFLERSLIAFEDAYWMMNEWTDSHPAGFGQYLYSRVIKLIKDRFDKLSDISKQLKWCLEKDPEGTGNCREKIFDSIKESSKLNFIGGQFLKSPSQYNLLVDAASIVKVTTKKSTISWLAAQDIPYLAGNFLLYLLRNFDLKRFADGSLELTISDSNDTITYRFSPSTSELLTLLEAFSAQDKGADGKLLFKVLARVSADSSVSYSTLNYRGKVEYQEEISLFEFLLRSLGFSKYLDVRPIVSETFRPGGILDMIMSTKDSIKDALRDVYAMKMAKQMREALEIFRDFDILKKSLHASEAGFKEETEG
jgi:hypothetical protein